jgi:hypothetical protein
MKPALKLISSALVFTTALVACVAPPAAPPTAVQPTPAPAPKPLTPTVKPRGVIELSVDTRDQTVKPQALNPNADSSVSFPTAGRFTEVLDVGANRYIMVRFPVTVNQAFNNLTLVAYTKDGNEQSSAFKAFQSFGGAPTSSNVYSIRPAHGMTSTGTAVDPNKADLQVLTSAEASTLTTAARAGGTPIITATEYALEYGYVARRCTANCSTTPTWARNFAAGNTGQVTVAVRVPQTGDPGSGYRFSMTFIVSDDTSTQYSQSLEEIANNTVAGIAQTNAAVTGATSVRVLCNSAYSSANRAFVLGARMAGAGAIPLAQYGAQFYRNATAASFSVIPNTIQSFTPGVAPLYTALNGASLSFGGGSSANGANVTVNSSGAFDFNPKAGSTAGDTMNFTASDDQGCTAAPQTAPVAVSGPVIWYVNGAFAGTPDGRKTNPFTTVAAASTASSTGHTIFVYQGSYTGLTLKANQNLIGQFEGLAVQGNNVVPTNTGGATVIEPAAGTIPTLTPTSGDTLTLANGTSAVRGVRLGGVAGSTALKGSSFGTLSISNSEINTPGTAIDLSTGALNATLKSVSSGAGSGVAPVNGVKLTSLTGAGLTVTGDGSTAGSGGTIQRSTGDGVAITSSTGLNLRFMNFQNISGRGVFADIQGAVALNLVVKNNAFQNLGAQSNAVRLLLSSTGASTFDVSNNNIGTLAGTNMSGVTVLACSASACNSGTLLQGRINNNSIIYPASSDRKGIDVGIAGNGKLRLEVVGNTIQNYGEIGLDLSAVSGGSNLQATITGNTISAASPGNPLAPPQDGMWLHVGSGSGFTGNVGCFNIATATGATANTVNVPAASGFASVYLDQRVNTTFAIQGYTGAGNSASAVQTFMNSKNTFPSATAYVEPAGGINIVNFANATCETPSF